jgi:triacylglycerol lipase
MKPVELFTQGRCLMFKNAVYGRLALAIIVLGLSITSHSILSSAKTPEVDFALIYRAAELSNQAYDNKSKIVADLEGNSAKVATPGTTDVQYFIGYNDTKKLQGISVRGTDNETNWSLDKDTRLVRDDRTGILMHRGFRAAALAVYEDVKPRLKPGYTTYVTGHSLGGAVAAIVGIYLQQDGVKLGGIYTFGQPKFTNLEGARQLQGLPLLRVIYQNDTVVLLPDSDAEGEQAFVHVGAAINILSGPYYAYASAQQTLQFSQGSLGRFFTQISLPDHMMKWYLQGVREKLQRATQVKFEDRDKYIVRHKYGTGADTAPVKRQFNFNKQN